MSRFSGLPDLLAKGPATPGARFANLPEQLASMSRPENVDRIRAAAKGEAFTGRLGTTKTQKPAAAAPKPSAPAATAPKKSPAQTPQPPAIAIPADVAARGPEAVAAYEVGYARAMVRGAELSKHPAVAGRSAEAMQLFSQGKSNSEIISALTVDQRAKAADAVWAKARASIYGQRGSAASAQAEPTNQPASAHKLTVEEMKADAVWDRARAAVYRPGQTTAGADQPQQASTSGNNKAAGIWDRAWAKVAGQQGAA